ncbi:hypothetical protein ABZR86_12820 [Dyella marensis]|jgi:hypothetical protein|uniref:Helix-turn-helix domain-containing protein n=1 Tax=Dyella marensis TaxID=500610 RepID=A0A1I2EXR7_9GAMM|nr:MULTISPECIES: hypothetical protein [Dyella]SFE97417.1 hypothetical protein SAMN02799615_02136 [Dyella marensis]
MLTAMMLRAQRAIVHRFEEAGATSTESARGAEELKLTPGIAWYQLVERGVLRCPGEGRYFLDRERWELVSSRRRHHAWVMVVAVVALLLLLFWLRTAGGLGHQLGP